MKELERIEIGEPVFIRNLLVYPLYYDNNGGISALSLDEAIKNEVAKVRERNGGTVSEVIFENLSDQRIFAIDGEEMIGALQNRVTNTAFFAEENSRFPVPVTCVEEGRWAGKQKNFEPGEISFATLRAILCKTTSKSLYKDKSFEANQSLVWETVKKTLDTFKIKSSTLSMHDTYVSLKKEIDRYIENLDLKDAKGMVAFAGKKFLCMDYFVSKELFNKYKNKIMKGYAIDAMMRKNETTEIRDRDYVKDIIDAIRKGKVRKFHSLSLGKEIRLESKKLIGRALEYDNNLVHISLFEK